ncbi:nitrite/sulfite reductase [Corynebacterium sp. 153RC1]|uniref:nitrite/sulfite reductase n=1 Tax=unclassified Corynebacterium TaxID=2624378 RepID=UPI00211C5436|nr:MULTISPECIES: nitrite/sulfite reductase [unclassified Corynebacterium]MCQ9353370.1 nitrite/sulfite reductase [Corynebacterium sp. 209RC1]MCQ9355613.1 nitrite/sulfite reductase [Corynebacterium sp. 1222RC1]MCQ9357321.1 nitrite/sulfite reductase [Corynebacterium sp. 122RC1]MCQ9359497.1 nitrite/sulfite reductase [Corynebacterium sp. 142RC1]MCQ9362132.1 nitrite/sulfite reductase [Corynebacterium sp. 153RC1]
MSAPTRARKPEGQWKIDGTEPLNADERIKQEDDGLSARQRVIDIYSKQGFASIPAEDLAPRFKWLGLYTQRRQDLGGELTGQLENSELQDEYFMLRVRFDGGRVTPEQLRVVGEISRDYARSTADFTDRQNIQLHWIRIEDVPTIWEKLEAVGLSTLMGCGDVPRVILGSPVAGIAADEIIDATPAIEEIVENYLMREEFVNLPRKFKSAISGNARQDITHEIQDIAFIGVEHPEHGPGFECFVGGGLSTNPMLSQSLGAWVPIERVPEVWAGVAGLFRDYGFRRLRNRARLKFLVAQWGIEKFREVLETEYLTAPLIDGPSAPINPGSRDHLGVHPQKDGNFYVGVKPTVGHATGEQLIEIAQVAEDFGLTRLRTTPDKELLFLDVPEEQIEPLSAALDATGLYSKPSEFRRGIISCTGLEFCKLAHVTTKARAIELVDDLEARLGDLDVPLKISLNGCPNACARSQVADIGLKGQTVTDEDGNRVEGFQVHLGGALGLNPDFGRKLRGHKVTSVEVGDYVVRLVEKYKQQRTEGEQFREWVLRADEADLQ